MRTTKEWWRETKGDPARLIGWLYDQHRGEATAAVRIRRLAAVHAAGDRRAARILEVVAAQEEKHAAWVGELLAARGQELSAGPDEARYWREPTKAIVDLETGCAVGAHAERMRLERIEEIASDPEAPADVREVFSRILPEERFHERAFRRLAGPAALEATRHAHELGREALGLAP